ncbi:unnamed protein product [Linum trigynum]|uniref:Uncharacterized protein n=1 Tax=Linum trigynum TaxID=586398 RepID=A0AAV2FGM3_9ROSI
MPPFCPLKVKPYEQLKSIHLPRLSEKRSSSDDRVCNGKQRRRILPPVGEIKLQRRDSPPSKRTYSRSPSPSSTRRFVRASPSDESSPPAVSKQAAFPLPSSIDDLLCLRLVLFQLCLV